MLSLTSRLCWKTFLSPRFPSITPPPYILHQVRTKKRIRCPPDLYPDHLKRIILGKELPADPATNRLYLKDIEKLRHTNAVTKLGAHKKGQLYLQSIHGRAELVVELMRAIDRQAMQKEYMETGKLRIVPELNFYLERAYYILRGTGDWTKFPVHRELKESADNRKRQKHSLWTLWPRVSRLQDERGLRKHSGGANISTPPWVVNRNLRQFMRRFTITTGSELEELWARQAETGGFNGPERDCFVDREEIPRDEFHSSVKKQAPSEKKCLDESKIVSLEEALRNKPSSSKNEDLSENGGVSKKGDVSEEMEVVSMTEEVPKTEDLLKEGVLKQPQIWQPNQKDLAARQSTFSHPSQTSIAQATKQLRSEWSPRTFHDLNLIPGLPEAIESELLGHLRKEIIECTDIQKLVIPIVTKLDTSNFEPCSPPDLRSFLIAAETGSGKTLAYIAPLINRLKREEEWALQNKDNPNGIFTTHRAASPRSIIVVPTSELAEQIYGILKKLSHTVKLTVCALLPKFDDHVIRKSILSKYIDVLISTPHRLNEFIHSNELRRSMVRYLIVDEADTLFDRSFQDSFPPLLKSLLPTLTHLVLCSATIPSALEAQLSTQFPGMQRIVTPKIHTAPRRIDFQVAFESDKRAGLLSTLRTIQTNAKEPDVDVKRTIVFCNARETVREVYEYLKAEEDIYAEEGDPLHLELIPFTRDNYDRHTALERFNERSSNAGSETEHESNEDESNTREADEEGSMSKRGKKGKPNSKALRVLITTDMASRGLDTLQCKTLVLYDVPFSNIDLLHRLGRTARAGKRGQAIMLVSKAEYRGRTREWVNEIRDRVIKGLALV